MFNVRGGDLRHDGKLFQSLGAQIEKARLP